jgi:hypothetical protein
MNEMVERLAVALAKSNGGDFYDPNFYTEEQRNVWRTKARCGIEAMRKPTDEMVTEGLNANPRGPSVYPDYDAARIWSSMIDAALGETSDPS